MADCSRRRLHGAKSPGAHISVDVDAGLLISCGASSASRRDSRRILPARRCGRTPLNWHRSVDAAPRRHGGLWPRLGHRARWVFCYYTVASRVGDGSSRCAARVLGTDIALRGVRCARCNDLHSLWLPLGGRGGDRLAGLHANAAGCSRSASTTLRERFDLGSVAPPPHSYWGLRLGTIPTYICRPIYGHRCGRRACDRCFTTALRQCVAGDCSTCRVELAHSESLRPLIGRAQRHNLGRRIRRARCRGDFDRGCNCVSVVAERRGTMHQYLSANRFRAVPAAVPRFEIVRHPRFPPMSTLDPFESLMTDSFAEATIAHGSYF
jgi:hypothetical protein